MPARRRATNSRRETHSSVEIASNLRLVQHPVKLIRGYLPAGAATERCALYGNEALRRKSRSALALLDVILLLLRK